MTWDSIVDLSVVSRKCKLIACLVCFFYIGVTLFFYLWSSDNIHFAFLRYQQSPTWNNTLQTDIPLTNAVHVRSAPVVNDNTSGVSSSEKCNEISPLLVGPLHIEFTSSVSLDVVRKMNPDLHTGGRFKPSDCIAVQKVAIIIPFRNRDEHLKYWLYYLHPILQRQQLDYGVYVINQILDWMSLHHLKHNQDKTELLFLPGKGYPHCDLAITIDNIMDGDGVFNRAKLFNIGYAEALKEYDYDCFVFSDVDLVPMDDRNIYKCFSQPRHLSVSLDKFGFRLPYPQIFGGLSAMSKEQFLKINGFPNNYWGWGGEDDDMYNRLTYKGMSISRPDGVIGRCRMIRHDPDKQNEPNPQRFDRIAHTRETMHIDGINSVSYKVVKVEKDQLYAKITVDVGAP